MRKLYEIAKATVNNGGSKLLEGKTQMTTEDVIKSYPDGITISGVDMIKSKKGAMVPAFIFLENPEAFIFGGKVLTDLVGALIDAYGDLDAVNDALHDEGGLKLAMSRKISKDGRAYTAVDILD